MFKYLIGIFCIASSASFSAHSALVSHYGYTLDTETNIVTGNGLDWLRWDQTTSLTVSDALTSNPGFRLASSSDMSQLLNSFTPEAYPFIAANERFERATPFAEGNDFHDDFIELFGETFSSSNTPPIFVDDERLVYTQAYFDAGANDSARLATVQSDLLALNGVSSDAFIRISDQFSSVANNTIGSALVRDIKSVPELSASAAPISMLLLSSLLCLGAERRRRQKKA